jgi:transcriptional regulator with XRE-family HTH domain
VYSKTFLVHSRCSSDSRLAIIIATAGERAMNERKRLGQRIRHLRRVRGDTQEELAERSNINPKYLSSIERGEENPTLTLLIRLATGLEVELTELFQYPQEGESRTQLRQHVARLIADLSEEDLRRVVRVLEALIR